MCFDNARQLSEIEIYRQRLSRLLNREVDLNAAAFIWIRKYARIWRLKHPAAQNSAS